MGRDFENGRWPVRNGKPHINNILIVLSQNTYESQKNESSKEMNRTTPWAFCKAQV